MNSSAGHLSMPRFLSDMRNHKNGTRICSAVTFCINKFSAILFMKV